MSDEIVSLSLSTHPQSGVIALFCFPGALLSPAAALMQLFVALSLAASPT